ncbi:MAG TPA: PhzF family phenazine biosynthesis protein [Methylomirabilota bacterium]|nr:PhzF family phenazine biosynthesis protein [Methylomirabilota bacterium]
MPRRYKIYDVFTERPLEGNPLAVVLDSEGLDDAAMQAIAAEFNLSETVFVWPSGNPAHTARLRIFTPKAEIPFAGHPTVGTAVCLARERFDGPGEHDAVVVLKEEVGPVRCGVRLTDAVGFAEFDCPKLPDSLGEPAEKELAAAALGLDSTEVGFENHVPSHWSAGNPFHFVPVRNMGVLAKAAVSRAAWTEAFGEAGAAFLYTRETEGHDHSFRARMFAPTFGIEEDPATGSAVAAFAGPMQSFDQLPDGDRIDIVEQGFEMGRPSLIRLETSVKGGRLTAVRIGGNAVEVAAGLLAL